MLLGAGLVSLGWAGINFWPENGNPGSTLPTTLLLAAALAPTTLALVTLLSRPIRGHWLARHGFSGPGGGLDGAAAVNLLLLLPENLNTPNLAQRLIQLKQRGVQTIFATPQPPATAAAIAATIGADDFRVVDSPVALLALIETGRNEGWLPAMATTSEACLRPLQRVSLALTGVAAAPTLRQAAAMVDVSPGTPRIITLVELGHQWHWVCRLLRGLALLADGLKWLVAIPAAFPALGGAIGLSYAAPAVAATTALAISGITALACGAFLYVAHRLPSGIPAGARHHTPGSYAG
ncbi:MAG: hypothetical protein Kow0031_20370 [Anaerolineae bacterium]